MSEVDAIRQEQFWFTATTLGLTGFIGALIQDPTIVEGIAMIVAITLVMLFTEYLLVIRYRRYCQIDRDKQDPGSWLMAFRHAVRKKEGTLYCLGVVFIIWSGFTMVMISRIT